jgi:hypothetical protein
VVIRCRHLKEDSKLLRKNRWKAKEGYLNGKSKANRQWRETVEQ